LAWFLPGDKHEPRIEFLGSEVMARKDKSKKHRGTKKAKDGHKPKAIAGDSMSPDNASKEVASPKLRKKKERDRKSRELETSLLKDSIEVDAGQLTQQRDAQKDYRTISLTELSVALPQLQFAVVGDFDTWAFAIHLPQDEVANELPAGLELRPVALSPEGTHPVICFAGRQSNVRFSGVDPGFCPLLEPLGGCLNYLEIAAAVPFVARVGSGSTVPHFCSTHLFLDEPLPVFLGWLTGLPKQLANLSMTSTSITTTTLAGADVFEGTFRASGPFAPVSSFAHFSMIRSLFEQVHVGSLFYSSGRSVPTASPFMCVPMDLRLDHAEIQPVSANIDVTDLFFPPMPNHLELDGIDTDPFGAFRLHCSWRMSPPYVC
jgi:hypothetical protein